MQNLRPRPDPGDRTLVHIFRVCYIIHQRKEYHASKDRRTPVHIRRLYVSRQREESERPRNNKEQNRNGFNYAGPFTHAPAGGGQSAAAPPLESKTGDRDYIG